jgi:hypothetical protein
MHLDTLFVPNYLLFWLFLENFFLLCTRQIYIQMHKKRNLSKKLKQQVIWNGRSIYYIWYMEKLIIPRKVKNEYKWDMYLKKSKWIIIYDGNINDVLPTSQQHIVCARYIYKDKLNMLYCPHIRLRSIITGMRYILFI